MRYFGLKWELTLGQAARGLHIPSGLGMQRDSPEQVREHGSGEEHEIYSALLSLLQLQPRPGEEVQNE